MVKKFKGFIDGKEYTDEKEFDEAVKNLDWDKAKHTISYNSKELSEAEPNEAKSEKKDFASAIAEIESLEKEIEKSNNVIEEKRAEREQLIERIHSLDSEIGNLYKENSLKTKKVEALKYKIVYGETKTESSITPYDGFDDLIHLIFK